MKSACFSEAPPDKLFSLRAHDFAAACELSFQSKPAKLQVAGWRTRPTAAGRA